MKGANECACYIAQETTEGIVAGGNLLDQPGFGAGNTSTTPATQLKGLADAKLHIRRRLPSTGLGQASAPGSRFNPRIVTQKDRSSHKTSACLVDARFGRQEEGRSLACTRQRLIKGEDIILTHSWTRPTEKKRSDDRCFS